MSKTLHNYELNYSPIEKQAPSVVKANAHFITHILSNHVISHLPHSPVKMILNQQLIEGRWDNWLAKIQEYDIEIKPLKAIRGQGLCKFVTRIEVVNTSFVDEFNIVIKEKSLEKYEWYTHIIFYWKSCQFLPEMSSKERRTLKMKTNNYVLVFGILFR
jgi:hypothetical protein